MSHLSTPWWQWRRQRAPETGAIELDAVVIGSGYGGAVAALRLAERGYAVTVLERGGEYRPGDFPNDLATAPKHFRVPSVDGRSLIGRATGLYELRAGPGLVAVVGNGLGGGSLVNAGVLVQPDEDVFAQEAWPGEIRSNAQALEQGFVRARSGLRPHSAASMGGLDKARALHRLGLALEPPRASAAVEFTIDPERCTRCGDCASGCNEPGAKITLRDSYLGDARKAGATLLTEVAVYSLRRAQRGGWWLRVMPADAPARFRTLREAALLESKRGAGVDVHARCVVIAAGTFGSTELLQRSRALEGERERAGNGAGDSDSDSDSDSEYGNQRRLWFSPALGSRLSANGDSLSFSANEPHTVGAMGVGADVWQPSEPPGAGAMGLGADAPQHRQVGPTITRMIDLRERPAGRDASRKPDRPAFEHRLLIQEGAVPGTIGRLYAEMLATAHAGVQLGRWTWDPPRGDGVEPLSAGHWLSGQAQQNAASMPQRTQVLLAMGHDRSAGRIVWVDGRDASVPYWEKPEELETYRYQERLLDAACSAIGGSWTPNPAWRLLPAQASTVMSGPRPSPLITTTHPLGGCPMSDSPRLGVVDHLGRVWAGDEDAGEVYPDLWILDGSIVPTSLGCNPMLTITALAERAMAAVPSVQRPAPPATAPSLPDVPAAQPLTRSAPPVLPVEMGERLACDKLQLRGPLAAALGDQLHSADLKLDLLARDWNAMWDDPRHEFEVQGTLRFEPTPPTGERPTGPVLVYSVPERQPGQPPHGRAQLLAAGWQPQRWRWIDALPSRLRPPLRGFEAACRIAMLFVANEAHLPRAVLTFVILRPDVFRRRPEQAPRSFSQLLDAVLGFAKGLLHACEVRRMRYELDLQFDGLAPATAAADAAEAPTPPRTLWLEGDKRVDYAASWDELIRWWRQRSDPHRPPLRATFLDQISHLHVHLRETRDGPSAAEPRTFELDFKDLVGRLPLRPRAGGDLPGILAALAAYPLVFGRFALKTRLFDFRLPDYSGRARPDAAPKGETELRTELGTIPAHSQWLDVMLGSSSSDLPGVDPKRRIRLRLWRYRRPESESPGGLPAWHETRWQGIPVRKLRSVLLVHAFGQSGYSFTLKSVDRNLAEALFNDGNEVWILEHRISTRLPAHHEQSTIDQIARYDIPAAVRSILRTVRGELGEGEPLQMMAFAQCIGAAATAIALLSGRLSYLYGSAVPRAAGLPRQRMPMLAGLVISQTQPFCIGAPMTQAKSWVPALIRDALRQELVPFAVRGPQDDPLRAFADRLFSTLPVPVGEACPPRRKGEYNEDDCATCRRIRFIEAPLFRHANLYPDTHRELPLLFGDANVRLFAHAAKCVDAERLVTEDGEYGYVTDAQMHRHMALPVCFLHGRENELFDCESATRSASQYARLHPQWADESHPTGAPGSPPDIPEERAAWIVDGYGHLDVLIAKDADSRVFPGLAARFEHWYGLDVADAPPAIPHTFAGVRLPRTGPLIGAVRRDTSTARLRVGLSMRIDDRFSDGKSSEQATPGSRTWAFARVRFGDGMPTVHRLAIHPIFPAPYPPNRPTNGKRIPAMRMAHGDLDIHDAAAAPGSDLQIECFSVHEALAVAPEQAASDLRPLHPTLPLLGPAGPVGPRAGPGARVASDEPGEPGEPDEESLPNWLDELLCAREKKLQELVREDRPARQTASYFRLAPEPFDSRLARISRASIDALAPLASAPQPLQVAFAVGTCRYPGFRFDRGRVDRWIDHASKLNADFGLLLGDQIYADATAGFADALSPSERFFERHRLAFVRNRGKGPGLGDWLAGRPVVMTPDDHEFHDGFPDGPPLVKTHPRWQREAQASLAEAARSAVHVHQAVQSAPLQRVPGVLAFTAGPARVLVLDTRSRRKPKRRPSALHTIVTTEQMSEVARWLAAPEALESLNVIATGSVLLPALHERSDPPSAGASDGWQSCEPDRQRMLWLLAAARKRHGAGFRVMLVSGDYHLSTAVALDFKGQPFAACVLAPPLYSPMTFLDAAPHTLRLDEPLKHGLALRAIDGASVWRGNGLGHLKVQRAAPGATHRFDVTYSARLWRPDQYEPDASDRRVAFSL